MKGQQNAQNGADLKIQFDTALTKEEARSIVNQSIETIDDNDIKEDIINDINRYDIH